MPNNSLEKKIKYHEIYENIQIYCNFGIILIRKATGLQKNG